MCKIKSLRNSRRLWNHLKSRQYRMEHLLPPQETDHKCAFFLSPLSLSILPHFLSFLESPPTQLLSPKFLPLGLLLKDSKLVQQVSNPITPTTVQIQNNAVTSVSFLRPLCSQSSLPTHNLSNHWPAFYHDRFAFYLFSCKMETWLKFFWSHSFYCVKVRETLLYMPETANVIQKGSQGESHLCLLLGDKRDGHQKSTYRRFQEISWEMNLQGRSWHMRL